MILRSWFSIFHSNNETITLDIKTSKYYFHTLHTLSLTKSSLETINHSIREIYQTNSDHHIYFQSSAEDVRMRRSINCSLFLKHECASDIQIDRASIIIESLLSTMMIEEARRGKRMAEFGFRRSKFYRCKRLLHAEMKLRGRLTRISVPHGIMRPHP